MWLISHVLIFNVRGERSEMNKRNNNFAFILITEDFQNVVCKGFTKLKNNPFYGIYLDKFNYDLKDNYLTFNNEIRAENAMNHFYVKELMEKEKVRLRTYCISKNTSRLK